MESEFRCYADPRPKLPGGRLVTVTAMPKKLSSVRYAFYPAVRATNDWFDEAKWYEPDGFEATDDFLWFQVPAVIANGLERGERYAMAVCDAHSKGMVRGEITWPDHPERWDPETQEPVSEPSSTIPRITIPPPVVDVAEPQEAPAGRSTSWVPAFIVLLVLLGIGGWLIMQDRDPDQPTAARLQPENRPPVASTITIETPAGEESVVDTREFTRDPDGETPTLVEIESAQFGTVEKIDDHRFRYRAPSRRSETDIFLYRVSDPMRATGEGWVFVTVTAGTQTDTEEATPQADGDADPPVTTRIPTEAVAPIKPPPSARTPSEPVSDRPEPDARIEVASAASAPPPSVARPASSGSSPKPAESQSRELRVRIADALDEENLQRVRFLCAEAMMINASLAKFCGIVFDPNKRLFEGHPDPAFSIACYDQAAAFGDTEANTLSAAVRTYMESRP